MKKSSCLRSEFSPFFRIDKSPRTHQMERPGLNRPTPKERPLPPADGASRKGGIVEWAAEDHALEAVRGLCGSITVQSIDIILNEFEAARRLTKQPVGSCRGKPCAANAIEQRRIRKCDY